ncbi:hypothetical protein OIO90_004521 [Microbotryomycetes sp. JL221]|nr:hypothetical protein OIO90_004521 [Microbotryomycetes sp. JL221]
MQLERSVQTSSQRLVLEYTLSGQHILVIDLIYIQHQHRYVHRFTSDLANANGWVFWGLIALNIAQACVPAAELLFSQKLIEMAHHVGIGGALDTNALFLTFGGRVVVTIASILIDKLGSLLEDKLSSNFHLNVQTQILRIHCTMTDEELDQPHVKQRLSLLRDLANSGMYRRAFDPLGILGVAQTSLSLALSALMLKTSLNGHNFPLLGISVAFMALEELDRCQASSGVVKHHDVSNDAFLRFQNMFKLGTSKAHRRDVISLGIQDHILSSALAAKEKVVGISTSLTPAMLQPDSRSPLRLTNLILSLARPIITTLFILQAAAQAQAPNKFSSIVTFAEMNVIDAALWDLRVRWSSLRRGVGDVQAGLDKIQALYEDTPSASDAADVDLGKGGAVGIKARSLSLSYPGSTVNALENVSFQTEPGQLVMLVGHNGSGKTTMLNLLAGAYRSTSGLLTVEGVAMDKIPRRQLARISSVAFQATAALPLSLIEYIALPVRHRKDSVEHAQRSLDATSARAVVDSFKDGGLTYAGPASGGTMLSLDDWRLPQLVRRSPGAPTIELFDMTATDSCDLGTLRDSTHSEVTTLVDSSSDSTENLQQTKVNNDDDKRSTGVRYTSLPAMVDGDREATIHFPDHSPEPALLSGGQWQRIVLARALCSPDTRLLLLDEPGSSLDPVAEDELFKSLVKFKGKTTTFVATHRLSVCPLADKVLVFEKGRLIEQGSHAELVMDPNGVYTKLWQTQAKGFVEA